MKWFEELYLQALHYHPPTLFNAPATSMTLSLVYILIFVQNNIPGLIKPPRHNYKISYLREKNLLMFAWKKMAQNGLVTVAKHPCINRMQVELYGTFPHTSPYSLTSADGCLGNFSCFQSYSFHFCLCSFTHAFHFSSNVSCFSILWAPLN